MTEPQTCADIGLECDLRVVIEYVGDARKVRELRCENCGRVVPDEPWDVQGVEDPT